MQVRHVLALALALAVPAGCKSRSGTEASASSSAAALPIAPSSVASSAATAMSRVTDADCAKWADHATDVVVGGFVDATRSCSQKVQDDVAAKFVAQRSAIHDGAVTVCAQHKGQPYRTQDGACFLAAPSARALKDCKLAPMTNPDDSDWAQMIDDLREKCGARAAPTATPM
jgi:hypothetical protein